MCGCWSLTHRVASVGEDVLSSPVVDFTPLGPLAGLLVPIFGVVRNIAERKLRERSKEVADERSVISKLAGSKKYMVATIVSAVLVAVKNFYAVDIDAATIARPSQSSLPFEIVSSGVGQ